MAKVTWGMRWGLGAILCLVGACGDGRLDAPGSPSLDGRVLGTK